MMWVIVMMVLLAPFAIDYAYAQSAINVTESTPCFLNYTSTGLEMLQNCGFADDYLSAVTISFDWVTGGLFPMILVTVLIVMTYLKYQNGLYPLAIGTMYLPFAYWAFPDQFISTAIVIGAIVGAGSIIIALIHRTRQ